jgi:glycosyltransferase involved in cell wall biosynthesis
VPRYAFVNVPVDLPNLRKAPFTALRWIVKPFGHPWTDILFFSANGVQALERILEELTPDLVVFEGPWLYRYLPMVQNYSCKTVLDMHNIEARLASDVWRARQQHRPSRTRRLFSALSLKRLSLRRLFSLERDFVRRVDQVWVCSEPDAVAVARAYARSRGVRVIPNTVDVSAYDCPPSTTRSFGDAQRGSRCRIVFPATFDYRPNAVGAMYLIEEIYPILRRSGVYCEVVLAGRGPTADMRRAATLDPAVIITGEVADMKTMICNADVIAVPLLHGGGTRLKILEAFAARRPVVSTSKGAEGIAGINGKHLLIADRPADFADAIGRVCVDSSLEQRLTEAAFELVDEHYSWNTGKQLVSSAIRGWLKP